MLSCATDAGTAPADGIRSFESTASLRTLETPNDGVLWASFGFVEGECFQGTIGCLVAANIVVLAAETDAPTWGCWIAFDCLFVLVFAGELALRLLYRGQRYFRGRDRWWSFLDLTIVLSGVADLLVRPLLYRKGERDQLPLLRILRLSRLVRMLRVFRLFPRLTVFLSALIAMSGSFVWIFSVLFFFIYVCALICTELFGRGLLLPEPTGKDDYMVHDAMAQFQDVSTSVFSLFQVTTQDNWNNVARPIIALLPQMRLFFVVFIVFVSWTMISVLTAVASNSMIEATSDRHEAERHAQARRQRAFIRFLRQSFEDGDTDGNGELDREEFDVLVRQQHVLHQMGQLGVDLSYEELTKTWQMLDVDGSGTLTIDAFVEGLSYLQDKLNVMHFLSVETAVKRCGLRFGRGLDALAEELGIIRGQHLEIRECLDEQRALDAERRGYLEAWNAWAQKCDPEAYACAGTAGAAAVGPPRKRGLLAAGSFMW